MKSLRYLAMCAGVSVFLSSADLAAQTREEAVTKAREGQVEEGIDTLRKLLAETPNDPLVAFDLAAILTWAKRSREAIEAFERVGEAEPPEYVLGPIIRAYRDQKRFADAERWAREAQRRFPVDPTWGKLLGLVLADQNQTKEAIEILTPLATAKPDDAEVWLALGYASVRAKDQFGTLRNYGRALRLEPNNREAAEAMAGVMNELGAPFGAAALLPEAPLPTQASQAGLLVRWGEFVTPRDPRKRFDGTDKALARLEKLLRNAQAARKPDRALIVRLRRDQVKALRNRERWAETAAAAQQLRADGDDLPLYVIEAEADALLSLRRPEEARQGYEAVIRAEPKNRNAHMGRFYCLVEEEKFWEAFREIDTFAASEQPGVKLPNQRSPLPNSDWLEGQLLATQARSFADMPGAAWRSLAPLLNGAPANTELRTVAGDFAAAREWPRWSDEEIHIAYSLDPEDRGVQLALAETAMRRLRWDEARRRIAKLASLYPADVQVLRSQDELRAHDSFELRTEFHYRYEKGGSDGSVSGSAPGPGTEAKAWLFSPPIGNLWRFVGAWERSEAKVTEGWAQRYREGAGFELALPDLTVQLMAWQNDGAMSERSADAEVTWQPTDHWTFRVDASYFAADTPLRAVLNQITANSAGGSVRYTWHESRSLRVDAHYYDFSDGNQRQSASITFEQKVVDIPHLDVTLRPEIFASENSSNEGPYFSPLQDLSAAVTIDAEHVIWRRYERSFGHRLAATGGSYWQKDFGNDWTGNVLYEQVWQRTPWCELRWGVQFNRAIYDGERTPSVETFMRLNCRF